MGTLPFLYEGGAWVFLVFPKRAMGSGFSNKKGVVSKMRLFFSKTGGITYFHPY